jgi:hypothetical protein
VARLAAEPISGNIGRRSPAHDGGRRAFRRSIAAIALGSRVDPVDMREQVHGVGPRSSRIVG